MIPVQILLKSTLFSNGKLWLVEITLAIAQADEKLKRPLDVSANSPVRRTTACLRGTPRSPKQRGRVRGRPAPQCIELPRPQMSLCLNLY